MKTIVIPAAWLGSRLSSFTKNYSKAMCTLGEKPVISYIIDKFEDEDEIIILLGYKGDLLRQVVSACHPNKNIKFVEVEDESITPQGIDCVFFASPGIRFFILFQR